MGGSVWLDGGAARSSGAGNLIVRMGVLLGWWCCLASTAATSATPTAALPNPAVPPPPPPPPPPPGSTTVSGVAAAGVSPPHRPRSSQTRRAESGGAPQGSPGGRVGNGDRRNRRSHRDGDRDGLLPGPAPPPPAGEGSGGGGGGGGAEAVHGDSVWSAAVGGMSWALGIEEGVEDGVEGAGGDWSRAYSGASRGASGGGSDLAAGAASAEAAGATPEARAAGGEDAAAPVGTTIPVGRESRAVGLEEGPAAAAASSAATASVDLKSRLAEEVALAAKTAQDVEDLWQRNGRWSVDRRWGEDGGRGNQQQERQRQQQQRQQHRRHASLRGSSISSPPPPPPPPPPPSAPAGDVVSGNSGSADDVGPPGAAATQTIEIEQHRGGGGGARARASEVPGASERPADGDRFSIGRSTAAAESQESRTRGQQRQRQRWVSTGLSNEDRYYPIPDRAFFSAGSEPGSGESGRRERGIDEMPRHRLQQQRQQRQQRQRLEPARTGRALQVASRVFPGGLELECNLVVTGPGVAEGGPTIIEPAEGDVLVMGSATNVSWGLDIFEQSAVASDGAIGTTSAGSLPSDLDIGTVNITLFNGDDAVWDSLNNTNTGDFSWTVPSNLEEARTYRVAVWDTASRICGISSEFGLSGELSITVTQLVGFDEEGTVDISPLRRGENASSEGGGEIYSCGGSVGIGWSHTGLLEEVDVRVCKEPNTSGTLAGLEDENLQLFTCLDPVSDSVLANSSFLNSTLTTVEDEATRDALCAVWGDGFFARVSWAGDGSAADVYGVSNEGGGGTVSVLGGVFLNPNDTTPMSILESQLISWEGRTGVGEDSQVDIILRSRASTSDDDFRVVMASDARTSTDGKFSWEEPWRSFTEEERATAEIFEEKFYLELYDAVGGGLICRSRDFILEVDVSGSSSDTSTLLLLLTPAALLLLCCCGVFFVACPYYDKIVRRRRNDLRPSVIDVDDTYIIDGEGQPAILALDSHVIPLAHAHLWPGDGSSSSSHGPPYILRRAASVNGHNRGGSGGGNSPSWTRAVLEMGQSVTESIGRAASLALQTGGGGGSSGGSGPGRGGSGESSGRSGGHGGGLDDACSGIAAVAGRGPSVAGSVEPGSSLSSWRGMRSGATWAFGGGGSIGRRSGGRRDGGGVYPTAAAALGLGLTPHHDFEEKSETAATGGASVTSGGGGGCGGSSAASTASNNNTLDGSGGLSRRRSGRGGAAGRGSIGSAAAAPAGAEGGFFYIAANGGVTGAGGPVVGMGAPGAGAVGGSNGAEDSNSVPSSSWYSRQSSRVDIAALLGRAEVNGGGSGGGAVENASAAGTGLGQSGSGASGTGWLGRIGGGGGGSAGSGGGGGGSHDREKVVTVVVSGVEADQVEIVEVSRAVVVDENGVEIQIPTTLPPAVVGMEIMEGFSDHGSFDGGDATSPIHSPVAMA